MADTTTSLDPRILESNLDALKQALPQVWELLVPARAVLAAAVPAPTRDGRINLRLPADEDGKPKWFGRTSIPGVRAAALVDRFEPGEANVLLPGIGEGSEAALLLERLGPHRAVFVWEDEPGNLLLAFSLHDYAAALRTGRLVPLVASAKELGDRLLDALRALPGHFCPERILVWPWQTSASIAPWRVAVEQAYARLERERGTTLAELRKRLTTAAKATIEAEVTVPSAVLLSVHPTEEVWTWADALGSGDAASGRTLPGVVVRTPGDMHPLARASRLAAAMDQGANCAVLLDACRADTADVLPADLPTISWLTREPARLSEITERVGPYDRVLVSDGRLARALTSAGLNTARVSICPLPLPADCCEAVPGWSDRSVDVGVVGHLWPLTPQAHGFELPTHVRVWNAAIELLRSGLDTFNDQHLADLLRRAEQKAGAPIEGAQGREQISRALAGAVAGSLILRELTEAISNTGLTVTCLGQGWGDFTGLQWGGTIPGPRRRAEFYRTCRSVLFASPTGSVGWDVQLAAGAGAAVVWRSHPVDRSPGGFGSLLDPSTQAAVFDRNRSVLPVIRKLLGDPAQWQKLVTTARNRCLAEHAPSAALGQLQAVATSLIASTRA